ncbi:MAG: hypothetical protein NTZ78_04605 [Candidatus Aureabacteria bacterium]|nr:hypothetical protein [Candidatus Auribacterota bacterium]
MRRTENGQPVDLTTIQEFTGNQGGLDGFADTHVIGYEEPDRIKPQRHHERDKLVRPRLGGNAGETAERAGGGACGEAGGLSQKKAGAKVANITPRRQWKGG